MSKGLKESQSKIQRIPMKRISTHHYSTIKCYHIRFEEDEYGMIQIEEWGRTSHLLTDETFCSKGLSEEEINEYVLKNWHKKLIRL